jgi:hypothetical protein
MRYHMHAFVRSPAVVPLADLLTVQKERQFRGSLRCTGGEPDSWTQLSLSSGAGRDICSIERWEVTPGLSGQHERDWFLEQLEEYRPNSATAWLQRELLRVGAIYHFEVYVTRNEDQQGWREMNAILEHLRIHLGYGVIHAEHEGFYLPEYSTDGEFLIAWDPTISDDHHRRMHWVAVQQGDEWAGFELDTDNAAQVQAFNRGDVPDGIEPVYYFDEADMCFGESDDNFA